MGARISISPKRCYRSFSREVVVSDGNCDSNVDSYSGSNNDECNDKQSGSDTANSPGFSSAQKLAFACVAYLESGYRVIELKHSDGVIALTSADLLYIAMLVGVRL